VPLSRSLISAALILTPLAAQTSFHPAFTSIFGGTRNDIVNAIALDNSGNIIVAGTTSSFDFPTVNAFQTANTGTPLAISSDSGLTWQPLAAQLDDIPTAVAIDPSDPKTIYLGAFDRVYKSTDGGRHFTSADLPLVKFSFGTVSSPVTDFAIDPKNRQIIYSIRPQNGVAKTTDGGQTWALSNNGLPNTGGTQIRSDPFHPGTLIAWIQGQPYRTTDAAQTWTQLPAPGSCCIFGTGIGVAYDPFTPDLVYANAPQNIYQSTNGGQSWSQVQTPFQGIIRFALDPSNKGAIYASVDPNGVFWKTTDGGVTWRKIGATSQSSPFSVDPVNPQVLLSGSLRSGDGGVTWSQSTLSRSATTSFTPSGTAYALAQITSDAFIRKYDPSGSTVIFSTYLGGQGDDSVVGLAVDAAGNIFVAGSTSSLDFPVTNGALQPQLQGPNDSFVAKISPTGGLLYATYLGGTGIERPTGIAVDSGGSAVLVGATNSSDFPGASTPVQSLILHPFAARLTPDGTSLVYATLITGQKSDFANAVAIDAQGNALITGQAFSPDFPTTGNVFPATPPHDNDSKVFLVRLSPQGTMLSSTYFGGDVAANTSEGPAANGAAIALDPKGNIYITGNTSAKDFPITPGAFQQTLQASCPYPSSSIVTGFIGSIFFFNMDDFFLTKISADGTTPLFSTFLGGNCYDVATSLTVDSNGNAWVGGTSDSSPFPLLFPVEGPPFRGDYKGVVAGISADGGSLLFSSYTSAGQHPVLAAAPDGSLFVAGSNLPGSGQSTAQANHAYLTKLVRSGAPAFSLNSIVNAFSHNGNTVAPGEIVSLSLAGYDPGTFQDVGLVPQQPLDTTLGETRVLFDGQPAYMFLAEPGRIMCFVPSSVSGQTTTQVQVDFEGHLSNILNVAVRPTALGLLSADGSGSGLANARNEDGSLNSQSNPAAPGSRITLFFTGAGITNPPLADGVIPPDDSIQPVAKFRGIDNIEFVGSLPGFVPGLFAIVGQVPTQTSGGGFLNVALSTDTSSSQVLFYYVSHN